MLEVTEYSSYFIGLAEHHCENSGSPVELDDSSDKSLKATLETYLASIDSEAYYAQSYANSSCCFTYALRSCSNLS